MISLTASSTGDVSTAGGQVKVTAGDSPPIAAIAGGAAGGAFGLAVIVGILIYYLCIRKKCQKNQQQVVEHPPSGPSAMSTPSLGYGHTGLAIQSSTDGTFSTPIARLLLTLHSASRLHISKHDLQSTTHFTIPKLCTHATSLHPRASGATWWIGLD